jgi:hypothetical protein
MPKITEKWIQNRILGLGDKPNPLSLLDIEKRFIAPGLADGCKILAGKQLSDSDKRILYAQQLRDRTFEVDSENFLDEPSRYVTAQTECREDNRVI